MIIASGHPTLALALSTQMPGLEARSASSPSTVNDLIGDDALVLLDLGSVQETTDWIDQLRGWGVDNGIVVVDAPSAQAEGLVTHLSRPFSVSDLATAFETTLEEQADRRRAASQHVDIIDVGTEAIQSEREFVSGDGGSPPPPPPSPAMMHGAEGPASLAGERPTERQRSRRFSGSTSRRRTRRVGVPGSPEPEPARDRETDTGTAVRRGLEAAGTLERLLADVSALSSVADCGTVLLDEIAADMPVGSSAVAMRGRAGDLELVAAGGKVIGVHVDHLALDHPFVRAVERKGGALVLSPTDEARGSLAGVPASHWPVLLAATITGEGQLDGIVLVGRDEPADLDDLERLCSIVEQSGDLLRLAASIRRLPRPDGAHLDYLHSWMR